MSNDRQRQIEERAHAIWEREGRPDGCADAHWRQAEAEIAYESEPDPDSGPAGPAPLTSVEPAEGTPDI